MGWEQRPVLDWHKESDYWQAIVPEHHVGPRNIPVPTRTYRVYPRTPKKGYEVFSWNAGEDHSYQPGAGRYCASLKAAKSEADCQDGSKYFGPYDGILDGFAVQLLSDVDGDRFLIIDERDHDMTGWQIEVMDDPNWGYRSWAYGGADPAMQTPPVTWHRKFDRADGWYCYDSGLFNHAGYGSPEYRYPWTALCDHGELLVRFLPPPAGD